jgi:hypothetical protein
LLLDLDLFVFVVIVLLASKSCLYQISSYRAQLHFAWAALSKQELCHYPFSIAISMACGKNS